MYVCMFVYVSIYVCMYVGGYSSHGSRASHRAEKNRAHLSPGLRWYTYIHLHTYIPIQYQAHTYIHTYIRVCGAENCAEGPEETLSRLHGQQRKQREGELPGSVCMYVCMYVL